MFFQSPLYGPSGGGVNPFTGVDRGAPNADLDFARRFGFARLATQQRDLAAVIQNPGGQMQTVLDEYATTNHALAKRYKKYLKQLRELNLPDEEVVFRADAYIRPEIARNMEMLRLKYPYSVGDVSGGINPLSAIEAGVGEVTSGPPGVDERRNWRTAKKAFKALKKARKS